MPIDADSSARAVSETDRRPLDPRRSRSDASSPPRDLEELRLRLRRCKSTNAGKLASVAEFALAHPYDMAFGSARGIATQCGVSVSPVFAELSCCR